MKEYWPHNSILNNQSAKVPTSDIFAAYCGAIGNYYSSRGFTFIKSRPKIRYETEDLFFDMHFWSSRKNIAGSYVDMEIHLDAGSKKLKKWMKQNKIGRNEFIYHLYPSASFEYSLFNIYGLTFQEFEKLINQLDIVIDIIRNQLEIDDNSKFIDNIIQNQRGAIDDNLACYLAMTKDERLKEYINSNLTSLTASYLLNPLNLDQLKLLGESK